jgi:predicted DCC family thiol-disulfide oxidoreductase YuxK
MATAWIGGTDPGTSPSGTTKAAWRPEPAVVLYDGQCPFCKATVKLLQRLDWCHRLHFQDCRQVEKWPTTPTPLSLERLLEQMHVVTSDRCRVYAGYAAFRWLAWRLPLLWPVAPWLYLPGVPWLGQRVYLWIARRRYQLVPCRDGVCTIPPQSGVDAVATTAQTPGSSARGGEVFVQGQ